MKSDNDEEISKADFFYRMTLHSYSLISKANERLDSKIRDLIGIITAIVPLTMGVVYFTFSSLSSKLEQLPPQVPFILVVSVIFSFWFFALAAIVAVIGYFPRDFELIDPSKLIDCYKKENRLVILQRVSATLASTIATNNEVCEHKAKVLKCSELFIVLGIGALVTAFSILTFFIMII